ncbi:MAG: hypothetical protein ACRDY3_08910 [Acidimicrobiales bacterium]
MPVPGREETTKDFEHLSAVLNACGRGFLVGPGIEKLCLPPLALGGVGFVSALADPLTDPAPAKRTPARRRIAGEGRQVLVA